MNNSFDLTGRNILVTGASSGIGRQCCVVIAACGARVTATGRDQERLRKTLGLLEGGGHASIQADLTSAVQCGELVAKAPQLDGIVHCAGVHKYVPLRFVTEKFLREMMAVNYEAPLMLTQSLLKQKFIKPGASIVFTASLAALVAVKGNAVYSSSKAALIAAARVMALELAGQRIRVNCIAPGMVRTPMAEQMATTVSAEQMAEHEKQYPLGFGSPEDVANVVVFLLSTGSQWITGQTLVVDGGFSCQ